ARCSTSHSTTAGAYDGRARSYEAARSPNPRTATSLTTGPMLPGGRLSPGRALFVQCSLSRTTTSSDLRRMAGGKPPALAPRAAIGDLAEPAIEVDAGESALAVDELFLTNPALPAVVTRDGGGGLVMVGRQAFQSRITGRRGYGRALHHRHR